MDPYPIGSGETKARYVLQNDAAVQVCNGHGLAFTSRLESYKKKIVLYMKVGALGPEMELIDKATSAPLDVSVSFRFERIKIALEYT